MDNQTERHSPPEQIRLSDFERTRTRWNATTPPPNQPWRELSPALASMDLVSYAKLEIACPECHGIRPERCVTCDARGYVCPKCKGRPHRVKQYNSVSGEPFLVPCPVCMAELSKGPDFDVDAEAEAIQIYLLHMGLGEYA